MGTITYRANLSAADFPFTVAKAGRTVIIPGPDQNFDRRVDPLGAQKDAGIPQAMYMDNVLPTVSGYQSVDWIVPNTSMTLAPGEYIRQKIDVKSINVTTGELSIIPLFISNTGVLTSGKFGTAVATVVGAGFGLTGLFSTAVVNGICYLFEATAAQLYTVTDSAAEALKFTNITATVTPAGFCNFIDCIVGSNNYLCAISTTTVYWSSLLTATDFVPSLVSGAGSINPNDSNNALGYAKETFSGFYLYTNSTTLLAQYTGNARYPWKFAPVHGATGTKLRLGFNYNTNIVGKITSAAQYVIEPNYQFKALNGIQSQPIATEVTELLMNDTLQSSFNYTANTFSTAPLRTNEPAMYLWLERYLLLSINDVVSGTGVAQYTHVIIFDLVLQRYGRFKVTHNFIFIATIPKDFTLDTLQEVPAFVDAATGTVKYLSLDIYRSKPLQAAYSYADAECVLVLGKFQYVRSRLLTLVEIELEGTEESGSGFTSAYSLIHLPSLDGRNFSSSNDLPARYAVGGVRKYFTSLLTSTAQNHTLAIKGRFDLSTVQLRFAVAGQR